MVRCGWPGRPFQSATTTGRPPFMTSMISVFIPRRSNRSLSHFAFLKQSSRRSGSVLIDGIRSSSIRSWRSVSRPAAARARAPASTECVVAISGSSSGAFDLGGMVMSVSGVNRQPFLGRVWAAFGVRGGALPVLFCHPLEQLGRGFSVPTHRLQRRLDGTVGSEHASKGRLVVAVYDRLVFGQQAPDPDRRHHLAVGEVVDDLARRPLATGRSIQLFGRDATQGLVDRLVPFLI